ncbi:MAG: carbamoyltransferase N-terminal domain-containing protein, partial [Candidatus Zixiibacteriota bacterium]
MNILGISAFYHDAAACLVQDGNIIAAAHEERFSRVKHDARFPSGAIAYCLREGKITAADLDIVCYYDKPLLTFERLMETYLAYAPRGIKSFAKALPLWLHHKLQIPREIKRGLGNEFRGKILFSQHHLSHAASAFYPSPFERAAILTIDGVGEWSTTTIGRGNGSQIEILTEIRFPHSLGLLYSAFTYYLGFAVNSGEYKLMGLAPYGEPKYADLILDKLINVKDDGSFWMDMSYFNYCSGLTMTSKKFHALFGMEPKKPEEPFTEKRLDIAASIQEVTNRIMLKLARHVREFTGESRLCLAGGVALNAVANGLIRRAGIFDDIWIQPAAGDAGGALGAALATWHLHLDNQRIPRSSDSQQGSYLGPSYAGNEITRYLDRVGAKYSDLSYAEAASRIAEALDKQLIVGLV